MSFRFSKKDFRCPTDILTPQAIQPISRPGDCRSFWGCPLFNLFSTPIHPGGIFSHHRWPPREISGWDCTQQSKAPPKVIGKGLFEYALILSVSSHLNTFLSQMLLDRRNRHLLAVENTGSQSRVGVRCLEDLRETLHPTRTG